MADPPGRRVAVALGSNLGDRHAALAFAIDRLSHLFGRVRVSTLIETEPEGPGTLGQPSYLNAAAVGESDLPAREILKALLQIERDFGRERPYRGAPRILDLDLILAGGDVLNEADLTVPHPRFRTRLFVLGPLAEVAADFQDPVTGLTVEELRQVLLKNAGG